MEIDPHEDAHFEAFVDRAYRYMKHRQEAAVANYGLTTWPRFHTRHCDSTAAFFKADGSIAVAFKYEDVGTYSTISGTWLWAWANDRLPGETNSAADKLLAIGKARRFRPLVLPKWKCDIEDAWAMTCLAGKEVNAIACYQFPQLYRDVQAELEKVTGRPVPEGMLDETYLYAFTVLTSVIDLESFNRGCVVHGGKCPGMESSGKGRCPYR
jgi:hypothetical protein